MIITLNLINKLEILKIIGIKLKTILQLLLLLYYLLYYLTLKKYKKIYCKIEDHISI